MSSGLNPDVEPAEVGLDPGRLARLDKHFGRYVDDGRLPGWLLVSRHGQLAYVVDLRACATSRPAARRVGHDLAASTR